MPPAAGTPVGSVDDLWRYPVKSMRGEPLADAQVTDAGLVGDRAYALLDRATGLVVSASNVRDFPGIPDCHATFVQPPEAGREPPPVRITLPDGRMATSDSGDLGAWLSAWFRREVTLVRSVPPTYRAKQATWFTRRELELTAPADSFVNLCPLSVMSTASLAALSAAYPGMRFDRRRFRMNIVVVTAGSGFVENGWVDRRLAVGTTVRIAATIPDPRCVMTTLSQAELPKAPGVFRAIARANSRPVGRGGPLPCVGVYARVECPRRISRGDAVALV